MTEFIGRLHPLLVHLPIGFLVLLGLLELLALSPRRKDLVPATGVIIALAIPAAILSAVCGWLLSWSGGYDEQTLSWHKWLGVAVAAATVILYPLHRAGGMLYRLALVLTLGLVAITGHYGGSLTHGSDYIIAPLRKAFGDKSETPATPADPADPTALPEKTGTAFADVVQPILNDYCVVCHGEKKTKGDLRLDSFAHLQKGGESGAVIVHGSAALSLLTKRTALPEDDDDHMPPSGKKQPTADDVTLLRWWIDSGASAEKTVAELDPPPDILKSIQSRASR